MIDSYLDKLRRRLAQSGTTDAQQDIILGDVGARLNGLVDIWERKEFRLALLFPCLEEAMIYEPSYTDLTVRQAVVFAVRNSILEDWHSETPSDGRLQRQVSWHASLGAGSISDPRLSVWIKSVTAEAISHFSGGFPPSRAQKSYPAQNWDDLPQRFPEAWQALRLLGMSGSMEIPNRSTKAAVGTGRDTAQENAAASQKSPETPSQGVTEYESGYSSTVGPGLQVYLRQVTDGHVTFFVPCFKRITRNESKLLFVIESLLVADCSFLSCNYYISRSHICRRSAPLRQALSTSGDLSDVLLNTRGLAPRPFGYK